MRLAMKPGSPATALNGADTCAPIENLVITLALPGTSKARAAGDRCAGLLMGSLERVWVPRLLIGSEGIFRCRFDRTANIAHPMLNPESRPDASLLPAVRSRPCLKHSRSL